MIDISFNELCQSLAIRSLHSEWFCIVWKWVWACGRGICPQCLSRLGTVLLSSKYSRCIPVCLSVLLIEHQQTGTGDGAFCLTGLFAGFVKQH